MLAEQKRSEGMNKGGRPKTSSDEEEVSLPSLPQMGIDHNLSAAGQRGRIQATTRKIIPVEIPRRSTVGVADLLAAAVRDGFVLDDANAGHAP